MPNSLRVAAYCWRASLRRRGAEYLALAVLIALLGGVTMASMAAAYRSQSAFTAYLAA